MALQQICEDVVVDTEGALGCVLLDLNTGLVLALARRPGHVLDDVEVEKIVVASDNLFRGNLMEQFTAALGTGTANRAVRETQITKAYSYEFMTAMPGWEGGVLVFITERTLSIGLGWMVVHQTRGRLAEARRSGARELPSGESIAGRGRLEADERADRYRDQSRAPTVGRRPAARWRMEDEASGAFASPHRPTAPAERSAPPPDEPQPQVVRAEPGKPRGPGAETHDRRQHAATVGSREPSRVDDAPGANPVAESKPAADAAEAPKPVASGPRAKMFRPRRSKR